MTRASLLHILNHVGGISEAEVRELEQLAVAFPYCQTAHLLLAKAAHDQGSMLASQRLRRAATYAVDRQLLRQLLEQPAPEIATEVVAPKELAAPAETNFSSFTASNSTAFIETLVAEDVHPLESQQDEPGTEATEELQSDPETFTPKSAGSSVPAEDTARAPSAATSAASGQPNTLLEEPATPNLPDLPAAPSAKTEEAVASSVENPPEATAAEVATQSAAAGVTDVADTAGAPPATDPDELPAVAPPIRPPAEAGSSRFEFGLSEPEAQLVPVLYQLPGLAEEEPTQKHRPSISAATLLAPAFHADPDLAYGLLPEGSRLGHALQLRDEELTYPLPTTEFFPPDALLHAHSIHSAAAAVPAPSSIDLINQFLKVQPRLKSPGVRAVPQEQADLAARSTLAAPALASESLAKILIKQGKMDRAIEIYEQLMVRQPEKSAYFADQIRQLKTSE